MPTLVHLTDEREAGNIKKNGLKTGKYSPGIYCMPVMPNFYVSHQWLRELKRSGIKTLVGVYFKADSKTIVFAGPYNKDHKQMELGAAIKELMLMEDPLGYEIIISGKVEAKKIEKIKHLPPTIGWRYKPRVHGLRPCSCDFCIKGSMKAARIRSKYAPPAEKIPYSILLEQLQSANDDIEKEELLCQIRMKKRRGDPAVLMFLLSGNASVTQELAITLEVYRHKNTKDMLKQLLKNADEDTRYYAAESMRNLFGEQ